MPVYVPPVGVALFRVNGGSFVHISFKIGKLMIGSRLILIARKDVSFGHVIPAPGGDVPNTI